MWPFAPKKTANRLAAVSVGQAGAVDVLTSVVSPNTVASPVSGMRSALLQIELLERHPLAEGQVTRLGFVPVAADYFVPLGFALLGESLVLRDADGDEIWLVAGRARFDGATARSGGTPMNHVPAELVPFLRRSRGGGVICYRESALLEGDKVRLKAIVEPSRTVVTSGYRSGSGLRYVARDDLAPVVLEEILDVPDW